MEPIKFVNDETQAAKCPRCGETLTFMQAQPVQVVDGKLNMQDSEKHFKCEHCNSVYRSILHTDYYQWYEK